MPRLIRTVWGLAFVIGAVSTFGCGGCGNSKTTGSDTRTPAVRQFQKDQEQIMTPHGKIDTSNVTEQNGKIQYGTQDGKRWEVDYSKQADGSYQYGTPTQAKK